MIIDQEKYHHEMVHKNVTYLNGFELGSRMAYYWFSSGKSSLRDVTHDNLGMFFSHVFCMKATSNYEIEERVETLSCGG